MWRSRIVQQQRSRNTEASQINTSGVNPTPITAVIQSSGLNGKTSNLATTTTETIPTPRGITQDSGSQVPTKSLKRGFCRRGGNRLVHPRLSLFGKPMPTKQRPRDQRYRKLRFQVNNFLERPRGWKALGYHMIV